jgi:hypothetical protein
VTASPEYGRRRQIYGDSGCKVALYAIRRFVMGEDVEALRAAAIAVFTTVILRDQAGELDAMGDCFFESFHVAVSRGASLALDNRH